MDRVSRYREILRNILKEYASPPSHGQIRSETIIDPENDHYELIFVGWDRHRRVHGPVLHLDIIDGKIWIQHDGTDRPVALELEAAGVPKEDIVLAFHPREDRELTGYAVG
jgi:XisI protein